jgi:hypothetical protein
VGGQSQEGGLGVYTSTMTDEPPWRLGGEDYANEDG